MENYFILRRVPKTDPQIRAELEQRGRESALNKDFKPGTQDYANEMKKYNDSRGIPPSVVEDALHHGKKSLGNSSGTFVYESDNVKVVTNDKGEVITLYPKGS